MDLPRFPLSAAQHGIWLAEQVTQTCFNVPGAYRIRGPLDPLALERSIQTLVTKHPALRTSFAIRDTVPMQALHAAARVRVGLIDLSDVAPTPKYVRSIALAEALQPIPLTKPPLVRATLVRLSPQDHVFLITFHHLVADGWSAAILETQLQANYHQALTKGSALDDTPQTPFPFEHSSLSVSEADVAYWRATLATPPPPALLRDRPSCAGGTEAQSLSLRLPKAESARLRRLARRYRSSLFEVLLAGYGYLLARYADTSDVLVGTVVHGREPGNELTVGCFADTLPLRLHISGEEKFEQVIAMAKHAMRTAAKHRVPFQHLVGQIAPSRNAGSTPLVQTLLLLGPPARSLELLGTQTERSYTLAPAGAFDVVLSVTDDPTGLDLSLQFPKGLFDANNMRRLLDGFAALLAEVAASPTHQLAQLQTFPLPVSESPPEALDASALEDTVVDLVLEHARHQPDRVALICESQRITYGALARETQRLASDLCRAGVEAEECVGVCIEPNEWLGIALFAVMRAGAAYLPIPPDLPVPRRNQILKATGSRLVLRHGKHEGFTLERIDGSPAEEPVGVSTKRRNLPTPSMLAYVIYTSGSTGSPKGVMVTHANLVRLVAGGAREVVQPTSKDIWSCFHSYAFDVSAWELWGALVHGSCVVMVTRFTARSPRDSLRLLRTERVTLLSQTPSAFRPLAGAASPPRLAVRAVVLAGEAVDLSAANAWRANQPGCSVINMYGITETTVHVTHKTLSEAEESKSPIGRPLSDMRLTVVDLQGRVAPPGALGELWVGGRGLARGYVGDPRQTAERFVPNPHPAFYGHRLYRSGDWGRQRGEEYEYCFRGDDELKIRGFRVHPIEIEAVLLRHPSVEACAVVGRTAPDGSTALLACISTTDEIETAVLREHLQYSLPGYMIPTSWSRHSRLPQTPSGKVDRHLLMKDTSISSATHEPAVSSSALELALASIMAECLGLPSLSPNDNFFDVGGHSLLAWEVIDGIKTKLDLEVPLRGLFDFPTATALARELSSRVKESSTADNEKVDSKTGELSFIQRRVWFLEQLGVANSSQVVPMALSLNGPLDSARLETSLNTLIRRHAIFRTAFVSNGGEPTVLILSAAELRLELLDLQEFESRETAIALAKQLVRQRFNLERPPLLRAYLLRCASNEHMLVVAVHHLTVDAASMDLILGELTAVYSGNYLNPLDPTSSYSRYVAQQQRSATSHEFTSGLDWWKRRLQSAPPALQLPTDDAPFMDSTPGGLFRFVVSEGSTQALRTAASDAGVTLYVFLLATFKHFLQQHTQEDDLCVATTVALPTAAEFRSTVGPFLNTVILRTKLSKDQPFTELLSSVRETVLGSLGHANIPFEAVVEALNPVRNVAREPLAQVAFLHQRRGASPLQLAGVETQEIALHSGTAKYDLTLTANDTGTHLECSFEFNRARFHLSTIQSFARRWTHVLRALPSRTHLSLAGLDALLDPSERSIVVGAAPRRLAATIHGVFEEQATAHPDRTAIIDGNKHITYRALKVTATQIAAYLLELGVKPEEPVAVFIERSADSVAAALGVLSAGAIYVPLDPGYPTARCQEMCRRSGCNIILTRNANSPVATDESWRRFTANTQVREVALTEIAEARNLNGAQRRAVDTDNVAYLVYTSGSTGIPKGVMGLHGSTINRFSWMWRTFPFDANEISVHRSSAAFVDSIWEMFGALLAGQPTLIVDAVTARDPAALLQVLRKNQATRLVLVPSLLTALLAQREGWPGLRLCVSSGEALPASVANHFRERFPNTTLLDIYGSSEVAADVTCRVVDTPDPSIGRPIDGCTAIVVDKELQPTPKGVPGLLCISGRPLARGYHGQPSWCALSFVPAVQAEAPGQRMYVTGDRAKLNARGEIVFLGRLDRQVKIRGARVELGEVEQRATTHPLVACAVAELVCVPERQDVSLALFAVPNPGHPLSSKALREHLADQLPGFMIPSSINVLSELPKNPNGKTDRLALRALVLQAEPDILHFVAPSGATELLMARIWSELLAVEHVGRNSRFFELGGHSLLVVRVVNRLKEELGLGLPVSAFFEDDTLRVLAAKLDALVEQISAHLDALEVAKDNP